MDSAMHTSNTCSKSSSTDTKDDNNEVSSSNSNTIATREKRSNLDILMLFIILCFMLSGVVINYCIILYIFTGVYWQKHDSIRKCVRVSATLSQFFLFTMVTCIVKRALYYRDERRFSDKFWRRLVAVVCPMVSNRSIESLQGKMLEQSSSENQPKEKWYITLTNFGRKYWSYLIVAMLFIEIVRCSLASSYEQMVYYLVKKPTQTFPRRDIFLRFVIEFTTIVYYCLSLLTILPTFCGIIHIYNNRIAECKSLEEKFSKVKINWQNEMIMKLSELKYDLSSLQRGTINDRTLANTFSSFYILNIIIYSASYAFYLIITARSNELDHWRQFGVLLISAFTMIFFMLYTNSSGNKLKKQTKYIYCVNDCEDENNGELVKRDTTNISTLSKAGPLAKIRGWETIVDQFDSYAVFFIFSSVPAQLLVYISGSLIPWVLWTVLNAHGYSL